MTTININTADDSTRELFDNCMSNAQRVGNKIFASIPLRLLEVGEYQRVEYYDKGKVLALKENFDENLMDPLTVSPHPEEGKFYIVNGMHRKEAVEMLGEKKIECEILQGMPSDPKLRLIKEANIFRKQMEQIDKITPVAIHKANMICGDQASIDLDEVIRKHGIQYKTNKNRGRCSKNTLTGFDTSLRVVKSYGKEVLNDIFDVLIKSGWQMESSGLGDNTISAVRNIFVYDPVARENKDVIVSILRETTPKLFEADSISRYKLRGIKVAMSLYLEDIIAEKLDIDKNIHNRYHVA